MKKLYMLEVGEANFPLRLTLNGQKAIAAKFPGGTLKVMMEAIDDPVKMEAVLDAALHYDGSPTPSKMKAATVYDMMVDAGYAGQRAFGEVIMGIATASGLITEEKADKLLEYLDAPGDTEDETSSEENPL